MKSLKGSKSKLSNKIASNYFLRERLVGKGMGGVDLLFFFFLSPIMP